MHKILLLLGCIFMIACQSNIKSICKQELKINIVDQPQTLDPRKARDTCSITVMKMLFEGLTRIGLDGKAQNAIADDIAISDDGKVYTFKLKKTFWTNGDAVTSYDFAYSWKTVLNPNFASSNAFQLYVIKGAKEAKEGKISVEDVKIFTPDASTLVLELENPVAYFLDLLSFPVFFPVSKNLDQKNSSWSQDVLTFVGNGPFYLKSLKHHDLMEVEKNKNYFDEKMVKIQKISMFMLSAESELDLFDTSELDLAGSPFSVLPVDALVSLKTRPNYFQTPFLATEFIRINIKEISDVALRKKMMSSFDRQSLVEHVLQSGTAAETFVPVEMGLNTPIHLDATKDIDVKQEKFTLMYSNTARGSLIAQTAQSQLKKNNIEIQLEPLERKVYLEKMATGQYQLALGSWIADFNDPVSFLNVFKYQNCGTNNTFWENSNYTSFLDQALLCSDKEKRKALLQQAENILLEEAPIIPLDHLSGNYLKNPKLKDMYLSELGQMDFKWAYIED
ncbi:MAG: peptide ABC transporter substrate-binding protein [Chlamydiae bacterium]|nr:peptide ABC transporter substrate-binding protein [Chlamydiota bacterium]